MKRSLLSFLIILFILSGCIPEENTTPEDDHNISKSLESLSINWNIKLKKIGHYYRLIEQAMNENKSAEYFNGVHDSLGITLSGTDLYDSVKHHIIRHFNGEISAQNELELNQLFLRLDNATYELNEILKNEQINEVDNKELSSHLINVAEYIDVSGGSTDLNLYNVIGNPAAVLREHSQSEVIELINDFDNDLKQLESFISEAKQNS